MYGDIMEKSIVKQNLKTRNYFKDTLYKLKNLNKTKIKLNILLVIVGILFLIALLGEHIVPNDPYVQDLSNALSPPSKEFIFGTDRYGRCMFSRVIVGARTTMFSALGLVAIPGMVFAIAVAGVLGGGIVNAVISLALISWPKFSRLARGQVLTIKNSAYIQAARLSGCSHMKIIFKHIFPNILGPIIVTATLDIGVMMMELAGLSFLGLGAMPPTAEWGSMMSNGRSMIQSSPWVIFAPGFAIFITVIIFNLLGDTVRDYLDVSNNK